MIYSTPKRLKKKSKIIQKVIKNSKEKKDTKAPEKDLSKYDLPKRIDSQEGKNNTSSG